jgi:hypothetical protein
VNIVQPFLARKGSPVPNAIGMRLSIDPGVRGTGWALWYHDVSLAACGVHEPPLNGVTRVVIEMPQTYPNSPVPYQDLVTLAFLAGRYIGAAQRGQFPVEASWVFPHSWKGNTPKDVCERRVSRMLRPEELAIVEECERYVAKGLMNNVWDAIGLGLHAYRGGLSANSA